jgi:hypothetical protein
MLDGQLLLFAQLAREGAQAAFGGGDRVLRLAKQVGRVARA